MSLFWYRAFVTVVVFYFTYIYKQFLKVGAMPALLILCVLKRSTSGAYAKRRRSPSKALPI
ncbi:hypothetical protein H6F86_16830 [Phormidium sp. FACHB-592]|uniref:Uncharacterized protein n=1 Tax=Stenomitos frigidus AS-A4 TaxID=2933935 RepID=A0ABV0KR24_9CYAN|nr:hypothetical protein [Phormidium sp. FACHB-592]MBD2075531.1 hypothetical protein [Phormidium sp. FACHB-592]